MITCEAFMFDSHQKLPTNHNIRLALWKRSVDTKSTKVTKFEKVVIPGDYKVAAGFLASSAAVTLGFGNPFLGIPIGLVGISMIRNGFVQIFSV